MTKVKITPPITAENLGDLFEKRKWVVIGAAIGLGLAVYGWYVFSKEGKNNDET